jgi:hypothetical protein
MVLLGRQKCHARQPPQRDERGGGGAQAYVLPGVRSKDSFLCRGTENGDARVDIRSSGAKSAGIPLPNTAVQGLSGSGKLREIIDKAIVTTRILRHAGHGQDGFPRLRFQDVVVLLLGG